MNSFSLLVLSVLVTLLSLVDVIQCELLSAVSFEKPFDSVDADGERQIGAKWDIGGSTIVNRHFVRLTPDRQGRRGYVWSKETIGRREFSLVITFRISGQAESWFGDGLALWITKAPNHIPGENHGFTGRFRGFGFVFDTFKNEEHAGGHQDITLMENNGSRTLDDLLALPKIGCMAPGIRYHEKNAAFSPSLNMSRVKIQYKNHYVQVSIDPKNTGEWKECFQTEVHVTDDWLEESTIGLTASTGGLADNHDVIALSVYKDVEDFHHIVQDEKVKNATSVHFNESLLSSDLDGQVRVLKRKYEQMIEDFEHQFTALKESTENTIKKLREQETQDAKAIEELEDWIHGKIREKIHTSVGEVYEEVDSKVKASVEATAKKSSGWKTPFFILLLIIGGIVAAGYKKYQDLRKSHLL